VPLDAPLASVRDEVNIVEIDCDGIGTQRFTGKGAGSYPTANAVVSDLLDVVARRRYRRWGDAKTQRGEDAKTLRGQGAKTQREEAEWLGAA
jgi:hypothetical protein